MDLQDALIKKGKDRLRMLKMITEELEVQLALGKAEARDWFEKEKKAFSKYIHDQRSIINTEVEEEQSLKEQVIAKIDQLESDLGGEVPSDKLGYDTYKQQVLKSIYELEDLIRQHEPEFEKAVLEQLDLFKAKLDAYRIQFALSDVEHHEKADARRAELLSKISELKQKLSGTSESDEKFAHFTEEMSASFEHLRNAFQDLFN